MLTLSLRITMVVLCVALLALVAWQVQRNRLLLRYSLLWTALAVVAIVGALAPNAVSALSAFLGFETPSNFILFAGVFFLLLICLSLSVIVSRQALKIKNLVQKVALVEKSLEERGGDDGL